MAVETTAHDIMERDLAEVLGEKYLSYALSTIMARSLPDVRDGLKPVHRRLLFAMAELNLKPEGMPKKSARVVGDVIGKYHPHGDTAVYDAMVRLAQDFAARYPLVDGQGNFGNIDGDNAAAMRYTEAKLTSIAWAMLDGIEQDAVDFRETYDGEMKEPVVLPGAFPNLLANGSTGIAVGMATSIPPHNVGELCDAIEHLIGSPKATVKDLVKFVKGPDFPTGGTLVEDKKDILDAYETGRGGFRVRAKWNKEDLKQGQYQIVVTEIPYQVGKAKLIEKIAELIQARKLPMLDEVHDESAEDIRVVLIPKNRNVDPDLLMESLFRNTDLESRFSLNMNVLDKGVTPQVMNLKQVLQAFVDHRREVLVRRSRHRLEKIAHRIEVLEGYLVAYLNLDEVIKIIREKDDPKSVMIKKFKITEVQADAILNMRLRALRKLEEIEIKKEHKSLLEEKDDLEKLVASKQRQSTALKNQIKEIRNQFGQDTLLGMRRTKVDKAPVLIDIPDEVMVEKEPITVVCSEKGWLRAMKGHLTEQQIADLKYKEGDKGRFAFHAETTDKLIAFATNGRFYTLDGSKLPAGRGHGEPVSLMVELGNDTALIFLAKHDENRKFLVVADTGHGFFVAEKDVIAQTKNGKQVLNVKGDAEAVVCTPVEESHDHIAMIGQNRKLLLCPMEDVPEMTRGKGVILQRYKDGGVSDAKTFTLKEGFVYPCKGGEKTLKGKELAPWLGKRGQAGRLPPPGFPRKNKFG